LGIAEVPAAVTADELHETMRHSADDYFRQISEAAVQYARSRGVKLRCAILHGHAADEIVRFAEAEGVSLIVLGRHGHSRVTQFFLGRTADRVSEHCRATVMIVK